MVNNTDMVNALVMTISVYMYMYLDNIKELMS